MSNDPLASPTLAQLYLEQGHVDRARAVLDEVLARDPYDGTALVLRERLRALRTGRLTCQRGEGQIEIRWRGIPTEGHAELRLLLAHRSGHDGRVRTREVSHMCNGAVGEHRVLAPGASGACAAAIGIPDAEGGFAPLAVADPLQWPLPEDGD